MFPAGDNIFWDRFYGAEGICWGWEPSTFARRAFDDLSALASFDHLAEIGAGYGRDSIFLADMFRDCRLSALDFSSQAISIMHKCIELKKAQGISLSNIEAVEWDLMAPGKPLPAHLSQKKLMITAHSLVHLWDSSLTMDFLKDLADFSGPGSRIILSAYSRDDSKFGRGKKIGDNIFCCVERHPDLPIRFYSEVDFSHELEATGWKLCHLDSYLECEIIHGEFEKSNYLYAHAVKVGAR